MARRYKHPSIEEAICEITLAPDPAVSEIDLTLPGTLQLKLGTDRYPGPTRQVINRTHLFDPRGLQVHESIARVQLPSKDGRSIIAIGRDTLSISRLRIYDGWENFKPEIVRVLDAWRSVDTHSRTCARVGLRYINRLVAPAGRPIGHWITDVSPTFSAETEEGARITGTLTAINNRREFETETRRKIVISLASLQPEKPATSEYLVDIDALADTPPLDDVTQIIAVVDELHTIAGAVFESLVTDNTRALLDAT